MTDNDQLLKNLKKFMKLTFLLFIVGCAIGAIGGVMIYNNLEEGQKALGVELLMPTIIATIALMVILSIIKKKLFTNKEEFGKAVQLFKDQGGQG